MHFLKMTNQK